MALLTDVGGLHDTQYASFKRVIDLAFALVGTVVLAIVTPFVLIGNLFLGANYYLWLGMGRVPDAGQFQKYIKYLLIVVALCFMVWATPRSIIATVSEIRAMGGGSHPALGFLGVMSAKNTAVNILILTTFSSASR